MKFKIRKSKTVNSIRPVWSVVIVFHHFEFASSFVVGIAWFLFGSFEIVSNFGFRVSILLLPIFCASHSDLVAALTQRRGRVDVELEATSLLMDNDTVVAPSGLERHIPGSHIGEHALRGTLQRIAESPPPPISVIKPSPFSSRNRLTLPVGNLSIIPSARITPTQLASPSFPPSRRQGAQIVLSIRDWYMAGLSTRISERKPRPPRHLPAPPESCHSSRRTMTADDFASRASTGRLCVSPSLIHTVAGMPSSPSLAPQPPPLPEPTLPLRAR